MFLAPLRLVRLVLGLALLCAVSASAQARAVEVDIHDFKPTQMELGFAAVELYIDQWTKAAADSKNPKMSLTEYAQNVLVPRFAKTTLPVIIDPDGNYRNTDGHHRISALREITALTGVQFTFKVDVLKDYTGWRFKDYARHFIKKLKKGQFTDDVEKLGVVERMRHIPDDYSGLRNNVLRSTFEVVFGKMGIKGGKMKNYFDFHTAKKFMDHGLLDVLKDEGILHADARELPAHLAIDARVVDVVVRMFGKPKLAKFLMKKANSKAGEKCVKKALARI